MKYIIAGVVLFLAMPTYAQYHAGGGCKPLAAHTPSADVAAQDGFDQHGNPIAPADANPSPMAQQFDNVNIGLDIPVTNYVNGDKYNADLSESRLNLGTISVMKDGTTALNGEQIKSQNLYSTECQ